MMEPLLPTLPNEYPHLDLPIARKALPVYFHLNQEKFAGNGKIGNFPHSSYHYREFLCRLLHPFTIGIGMSSWARPEGRDYLIYKFYAPFLCFSVFEASFIPHV